MKQISLLLVAICLFFRTAHAQSGDQQVVIGFADSDLSQALEKLQQQTGILFIYRPALLQPYRIKALPIAKRTLTATLDLLLEGTPLTYYLTHHHVVITAREKPTTSSTPALLSITGTVKDSLGNALPGAAVAVLNSKIHTVTNELGSFSLAQVTPGSIIQARFIGYTDYTSAAVYTSTLSVVMREAAARQLDSLQIQTGFQTLHPERVVGAYYVTSQRLLDQRVATNLLDKLDGVASGLLLTRNIPVGSQANEARFSIRGRSTINSDPDPLIVVDNFPYDGSLDNINPADVASVTLLKDAAAASIWGALSGNGVLVITTKTGQYNKKPEVQLSSNFTVGGKPDLYYTPVLGSADYLSVESYLFNKGYYNYTANDYTLLSPGVDILVKRTRNEISSADSLRMMQSLAQQDVRDDLSKYYYRPSFNQQYAANISGGGLNNKYYFSAGADRNLLSLQRNAMDRITIAANNTYTMLQRRLEFSNSFLFSRNIRIGNDEMILPLWPYLHLADATGILAIPYTFRSSYTDTAGGGKLLDWKYRPLDDLHNGNHTVYLNEYRVSGQLRYRVTTGLYASVQYQFGYGNESNENYYSPQLYYTRNLINSYTQINAAGLVYRPVPLGGILDLINSHYQSQNLRAMAQYNTRLHQRNELSILAGYDIRMLDAMTRSNRLYGYVKGAESGTSVDFVTLLPDYTRGTTTLIPSNISALHTSNNFLSWYVNGNYTYKEKYSATFTLRRDASNLFGVNTNQKGVPLWAAGIAWALRPTVKWRASYGLTGNSNNTISAYTTAARGIVANRFNEIISTISNPANASLRWEQVAIYNTGIDVSSSSKRISGSLDYYVKHGKDLIAPGPVDPTTGVSVYTGNTADMRAWGMDLVINSLITDKPLRWSNTLLLSINRDKVVHYKIRKSVIGDYINNSLLNPQEGYPLYSIYSFPYLGLNSTGDPVSLFEGRPSTAYSAITSSSNFNNLIYHGSATPTLFGSMRNTINWKDYFLNVLITLKAGYYFRRTSINYDALFTGQSRGHPDWERRWQHPGDEAVTNIPAMIYPANPRRDDIYTYSEVLVEKGDHIRLQDIQLGYELRGDKHPWLPFAAATIFLYANNIGILWRANKHHIDPDYYPYAAERVLPPARTFSIGFQLHF